MAEIPFDILYRQNVIKDVPGSGQHKPKKSEIRDTFNALYEKFTGANAGAIIYTTKALLDADLVPADKVMAWVIGDGDNDGVYAKLGATTLGSWEKRGRLPYNIIQMNNAGAGTANDIVVTTAVAMPSAAYSVVYNLNITADNTDVVTVNGKSLKTNTGAEVPFGTLIAGSSHLLFDAGAYYQLFTDGNTYKTFIELLNVGAGTANDLIVTTAQGIPSDAGKSLFLLDIVVPNGGAMTLSINGLPTKPMVTLKGDPISAGYFSAGMSVILADTGTTYKLYTPGDIVAEVLALRNEAETLRDEAEAARDVTTGLASGVILADNKWASKVSAEAWSPIAAPDYIQTAGYTTAGDGGGAVYAKVASEPAHEGKFSITLDDTVTIVWFEIAALKLNPFMFGGSGYGVVDDMPPLTAMFIAANALKRSVVLPKPAVSYRLASAMEVITLTSDLTIECQDAIWFCDVVGGSGFQFVAEEVAVPVMTGTVATGDTVINVDSTAGISAGDLYTIDSPKEWQDSWVYGQREAHIIGEVVDPTTLKLVDPFEFNFDAATDSVVLKVSRPVAVNMTGTLSIIVGAHSADSTDHESYLQFVRLRNFQTGTINAIDPQRRRAADPVSAKWCVGGKFGYANSVGNRYGFGISSGSRYVDIIDGESEDNKHPFVYSTSAVDGVVHRFKGFNNFATIETHPSLRISLRNITAIDDDGYSIRSINGTFENIVFRSSKAVVLNQFQTLVLKPEYSLYEASKLHVKNIEIVAPNAVALLGFTPNPNCLSANFENCVMPAFNFEAASSNCVITMKNVKAQSMAYRGERLIAHGLTLQYDMADVPVALRNHTAIHSLSSSKAIQMNSGSITGGYNYVVQNMFVTDGVYMTDVHIEGILIDYFEGAGNSTGTGADIITNGGKWIDCEFPWLSPHIYNIKTTGTVIKGGNVKMLHKTKGNFYGQPDANGELTIPHGLYAKPDWASVGIEGDLPYTAQLILRDATNLTVRVMNSSGSDVVGVNITILWEAEIL